MENYNRHFISSTIQSQEKGIEGRVFKYDEPAYCEGMNEVIPRECKVEFNKNCLALLSHKSQFPLGRLNKNLTFEKRNDGVYFKIKPINTPDFNQARELVKEGIIFGCSPSFRANPKYNGDTRTFDRIIIDEVSLTSKPAYHHSEVTARENKQKINYPPGIYIG